MTCTEMGVTFAIKLRLYSSITQGEHYIQLTRHNISCTAVYKFDIHPVACAHRYIGTCVGRVNPRRLRVPAFAGRMWPPAELCMRCGCA